MSRALRLAGLALLTLGGCQPLEPLRHESDFAQVPTSPFPPSVTQTVKRVRFDFTPASQAANMRVDEAGRKLLAANPQAVLKARFTVIGAAEAEIFHIDQVVYITEGLVQRCPGESELTAVLASELGKIVAQREAGVAGAARAVVPPPPEPMPVGSMGASFAADPGYYFAMAKYEQEHPRKARNKAVPPPDPHAVARVLLANASLLESNLDAVAAILHDAEQHQTLRCQFEGVTAPDGTAWRPHP
jgi:hypothetical protein